MLRTAVLNTLEDPDFPRKGDRNKEGDVTYLVFLKHLASNDFHGVFKRGRSTFHKPTLSSQWNDVHIKQGLFQFHPQHVHTQKNKSVDEVSFWCAKLMEKIKTMLFTVAPGYWDALKEYKEQETHSAGRVVVKKLKHIDSTLQHIRRKC